MPICCNFSFLLKLFFSLLVFFWASLSYADLGGKLKALVTSQGARAHIVLIDLKDRRIVFQHAAHNAVKPASTLKLLTSAVALKVLGPEHRFETRFFTDANRIRKGLVNNLYVVGGGDPVLTIEQLWSIVRTLKRRGVKEVNKIIIDTSLFTNALPASGQRAYEAGSSAMSFNHNSIAFDVCPGLNGLPARVSFEPSELSLKIQGSIRTVRGVSGAAFAIDQTSAENSAYSYRIGGSINAGAKCKTIYRSVSSPANYFGSTFLDLLESQNISVKSGFQVDRQGLTEYSDEFLLYTHHSKPLGQIIADLNHYSSNFIAEQILFAISLARQGIGNRRIGLAELGGYLHELGFKQSEFRLSDGSGLSHDNRLSALMLAEVLKEVYSDMKALPDFVSSLPIGRRSGTLKDRELGQAGDVIRAKTGSLRGVSSLAGYFFSTSGRSYIFVSILNGVSNRRAAHKFEEKFVNLIASL